MLEHDSIVPKKKNKLNTLIPPGGAGDFTYSIGILTLINKNDSCIIVRLV